MLLNEIFGDLIKHDLKSNRGQRLKKIVRSASARANPTQHGSPFIPGAPEINIATAGDASHFSGMS